MAARRGRGRIHTGGDPSQGYVEDVELLSTNPEAVFNSR